MARPLRESPASPHKAVNSAAYERGVMRQDLIPGLAGVVLCGGKSSRMGAPKAWLQFGGEPLLQRVVRVLRQVADPVVVVAAKDQELPPLEGSVEVVRDSVRDQGPLQGMAAGFEAVDSRASAVFVSSTDAPFLSPALIHRLVALRLAEFDIAVPMADGHYHPLSAVYGVQVLAEITAMLAHGHLRVTDVLRRCRTKVATPALLLEGEELSAVDPELRSLRGINTPEEYAAALLEACGGGPSGTP